MKPGDKGSVLFLMYCVPCLYCYDTTYTLLVMNSGAAQSLSNLWNSSTGGVNIGDGTKHLWAIPSIATDGNFKSDLVDIWDADVPDRVTLSFYNEYGDPLFWISFNGTGSKSDFASWMTPSRYLGSSHQLIQDDLRIYFSDSFPMYGADNSQTDQAWFAVWMGVVTPILGNYPVFLFSSQHSVPKPLTKDPRMTSYVGCYDDSIVGGIIPASTSSPLTIETCVSICDGYGISDLIFLKEGTTCNCGSLGSQSTFDVSFCTGECAGNAKQTICGTPDYYAVYQSGVQSQDALPDVPSESLFLLSSTQNAVSGKEEIEFDLTPLLSGRTHIYMTGIATNSGAVSEVKILYNFGPECNYTKAKYLENDASQTVFYTNGAYAGIGIIKTSCLYVKAPEFATLSPASVAINIYISNDSFIQAPILAITGTWSYEDSTTTEEATTTIETTTREITTPTTTAEQTTTTVKITTTEETTTTDTTTSSTVTTTAKPAETTSESTTATTTNMDTSTTVPSTESRTDQSTTNKMVETSTSSSTTTTSTTTSTTAASNTDDPESSASDCPSCNCHYVINLSINISSALIQKLEEMKQNLTVDKKLLSSYIRSKTSAKDSRPSSQGIGYVGVLVLCIVGALILLNDVTSFYSLMKERLNKLKHCFSRRPS